MVRFLLLVASAFISMNASAQVTLLELLSQRQLYSASSKAHGAPFDVVVTEIDRNPFRSYLSVPGFHQRTAAGTRWLMCVYTDLAIQRGFSHWSVVYPAQDSEILVVGFAVSETTPLSQVLGTKDYVPERTLADKPVPVEKFLVPCGIRR